MFNHEWDIYIIPSWTHWIEGSKNVRTENGVMEHHFLDITWPFTLELAKARTTWWDLLKIGSIDRYPVIKGLGCQKTWSDLKSYCSQLMVCRVVVGGNIFSSGAYWWNNFVPTHSLKSNPNEIHWITTTNNKTKPKQQQPKPNRTVKEELADKKR